MNSIDKLNQHSHRRLNILNNEWVQVSPHRTKRPWQGKQESVKVDKGPNYDSSCYLCPGNVRANGEQNPNYESTYVFDNDFAALEDGIDDMVLEEGLLSAKSERGKCRVICFSPNHSLTLPEMSVEDITKVIGSWIKEYKDLSGIDYINHVQIFENKGSVMGCSNPHPHGQVWAQESIPVEVIKKQESQEAYFKKEQSSLLGEYVKQELELNSRILYVNEHMVVLVPFWAVWPFETMIVPLRRMSNIDEMSNEEQNAFAEAIQWITIRYDNLFETSFPYSSGIHQAPSDGVPHPEWHWHMSFYPPLLRSATVKKFMVGYEMFANPQRDITPERASEILTEQDSIHYSLRSGAHS